MIFLCAFLTYQFFPPFYLFYCNISHDCNRRWKRPLRHWRLFSWIDWDDGSNSWYWCLWQCERREQQLSRMGRGFVRSTIYCWAAASQCYMVPTSSQFRGIHFFLNLKAAKKTNQSGPSVHSLDLPKRQNPSSPAVQGHNPGTKNASILTQASEKELAVDLMPDTLH